MTRWAAGWPNSCVGNVAAVDCGTLSTRLLVSGPDGWPRERLMRITRLGEGVDRTRRLAPAAVERTLEVLRDYRGVMDEHAVGALRMVGTSALRDAANREVFTTTANAVVGAPVELLSGSEEAGLSLLGATSDLAPGTGPWLMVDIGGGSTELAVTPTRAVSLDLGCVRVTERFFHHDPPTPAELGQARRWLVGQLEAAERAVPELASASDLVGLAGTVAALACWAQGLESYQRSKVHHFRLSYGVVQEALAQLSALPAAGRAGLPGIEPARAPLIVGGILVLETVMAHFAHPECLVSEADILDGLVMTLLPPSGQPR